MSVHLSLHAVWSTVTLFTQYCQLCLSVCDIAYCGTHGQCRGSKVVPLYHKALPIHFFRHFCCRMYHLAITHCEKLNCWNFYVWNSREHVWLFQKQNFWPFSSAATIPLIIPSVIGLLTFYFLFSVLDTTGADNGYTSSIGHLAQSAVRLPFLKVWSTCNRCDFWSQ